MVTLRGIVHGITHVVVQSYNDPWARRLRFIAFVGASMALTQILVVKSGGLMFLGALLWVIAYPLMWLRIVLVFLWMPMAHRRRRARAHAIRIAPGDAGGPPRSPPPAAP